MDIILSKAKAELAVIDQQIARLNEKQARLRDFVRMYGELAGSQPPAPSHPLPEKSGETFAQRARSTMSELSKGATMKSAIAGAAALILKDAPPCHTRALVPLIEQQGIEISAKDKLQAVSAILSADDRFKANRSVGWSLNKEANPAGTGSALFESTSGDEPDRTPSGH